MKEVVLNKKFILLWLVLFINIASGLAIIGNERQIYLTLGISNDTLIVMFTSINAFSNLIGRVICGGAQDKTDKKYLPYYVMTAASIVICVVAIIFPFGAGTTAVTIFTVATVFVIQFFFGCGFACLPNILEQSYGMKQLATIQGYMLTAWAVAGLVGNQISTFIIDRSNPGTLNQMYGVLAVLYSAQLVFLLVWVRNNNKTKKLEGAGA
jgi:OFA family oxalate/formate antiporter-like MFS transporter